MKNYKIVYQAPRGQSIEKQQATLAAKGITGTVYQIGDFYLQHAAETPKLCACFEYIGDNPHCPRHGKP